MSANVGLPDGSITVDHFAQVAALFSQINLAGDGPPLPPWGTSPTPESYQKVLDDCATYLPASYQEGYVAPLRENLSRLDALKQTLGGVVDPAEVFLGPIYDHDPSLNVRGELRRFLT